MLEDALKTIVDKQKNFDTIFLKNIKTVNNIYLYIIL